ncbi:hypothetical protein [Burkholderia glumae]|uniref:hypothetical protein n=1 Tax=Burkholderia glumae TaxID=337 RepID=UPI0009B84CA5|nr:hypothetical protein [Burkholderia glumae]
MNDRELLELAAKAAGIVGTYVRVHQAYGDQWVEGIDTGALVFWNPLTDDGDALRLAVKLRMDIDISINAGYVSVTAHREPDERVFIVEKPGDSAEALRRAITRAAAEIARTTDTGGEA